MIFRRGGLYSLDKRAMPCSSNTHGARKYFRALIGTYGTQIFTPLWILLVKNSNFELVSSLFVSLIAILNDILSVNNEYCDTILQCNP
jgi:hypothetical protein